MTLEFTLWRMNKETVCNITTAIYQRRGKKIDNVKKLEICTSTDYFLHTVSFYLGSETTTVVTDAAHYPNWKKNKREISSYECSKWKIPCRDSND